MLFTPDSVDTNMPFFVSSKVIILLSPSPFFTLNLYSKPPISFSTIIPSVNVPIQKLWPIFLMVVTFVPINFLTKGFPFSYHNIPFLVPIMVNFLSKKKIVFFQKFVHGPNQNTSFYVIAYSLIVWSICYFLNHEQEQCTFLLLIYLNC